MNTSQRSDSPAWPVLPIVVMGMVLRLIYLVRSAPWTDEYYTSLAIQMVAEKGVPIMPSGLVYTHGLPHSYAGAMLARLFGFSYAVARLPSLLISLPTLLLICHIGQRWFNTRAGSLATLLLALSPEAIQWGGTARMYALWQFFTLAAVYMMFEGLFKGRSTLMRAGALLALAGAMLCHLRTLLTIPAAVVGLGLTWWMTRRERGFQGWRPRLLPWMEGLALAVLIASVMMFTLFERPSGLADANQIRPVNWLNPIRVFADVLIGAQQFVVFPYLILTVLALTGNLALLVRWFRHQRNPHDPALLFLSATGLTVLVQFSLVSPPIVRIPRYLFDILPLYLLIVARELDYIVSEIGDRIGGLANSAFGALPVLFIVCLFAAPVFSVLTQPLSAIQEGFDYVREHWQPTDRVATPLPAVAYVALGRCDYFIAFENPFLWSRADGPVDPHLGLPWIGTADGLREVANEAPRLWIVVEKRYAEPYRAILGDRLTITFQHADAVVYVESVPQETR